MNSALSTQHSPLDVVVLGGGFAGVNAARHLRRLLRRERNVRVTLVSRTNYFLMTPLLFEAGSGVLEPRHAVNPIRPLLRGARFVQAEVRGIDMERRVIHVDPGGPQVPDERIDQPPYEIRFDHLVLALGGVVNTSIVPGTEHARTFKTLADAIALRNHVIQSFERADIEPDPQRKRRMLTFVMVGAGLVGVELVGELTEFASQVCDAYPNVKRDELRFELIEAGPRILPELEDVLARYAHKVLTKRDVNIRTSTPVQRIEPDRVHLPNGETIDAETIVANTGVSPNPLVASLPIEKDHKGRARVEPTLRAVGRPWLWALGDCASIPDPGGKPYPPLAQHALREAKLVAANIAASIREGQSAKLRPFVYASKGTLAALGHYCGVGKVLKFRVYGFVGWWVWRTYYLFQMPQWSRRLRIVVDWTIALLFKHDIVQLDLYQPRQGHSDATNHQ